MYTHTRTRPYIIYILYKIKKIREKAQSNLGMISMKVMTFISWIKRNIAIDKRAKREGKEEKRVFASSFFLSHSLSLSLSLFRGRERKREREKGGYNIRILHALILMKFLTVRQRYKQIVDTNWYRNALGDSRMDDGRERKGRKRKGNGEDRKRSERFRNILRL